MKRVTVQENAHILVIGFPNSNFYISNQREAVKIYCAKQKSEFGDAELDI